MTTEQVIDQDRAEFEAWAEHAYGRKRLGRTDDIGCDYADRQIELQWRAWQASRRAKSVFERPPADDVLALCEAVSNICVDRGSLAMIDTRAISEVSTLAAALREKIGGGDE